MIYVYVSYVYMTYDPLLEEGLHLYHLVLLVQHLFFLQGSAEFVGVLTVDPIY